MSSYLHTEPIGAGHLEIDRGSHHAQHLRELRAAVDRPRRLGSTGRRRAAGAAIGLALASASVACGAITDSSQTGGGTHATDSAPVIRAHHAGVSPRAFALRIRQLEARGYVEAACNINGILMINPRTHRSETVVA